MFLDMNPLESATTELRMLLEKKAEIDRKIDAVQQSIKLLEPVYGRSFSTANVAAFAEDLASDVRNLGITEAVERVLMGRPNKRLSPIMVRDLLVERGFKPIGENQMASIHTVLKRLAARSGPIVKEQDRGGVWTYRYDPAIANVWPAGRGPISVLVGEDTVTKEK